MKNNTSTCIIELKEDEKELLINLALNLKISPSKYPNTYCENAKKLSENIPIRIKNILLNFSKYGSETGFIIIKGFEINNIPLTPKNNYSKVGEKTLLSKIQAILLSLIGDMISYEAEGYGLLYQDIIPVKNMSNNQTSMSSIRELEIHTEQAFSNLRPDILSLACLRTDKSAFTYILPIKYIIDNISDEELKLLKMPLWKIGVDLSFKLNNNNFIDGEIRGPISIINDDDKNDPKIIFDQDLMIGITEESNNLISKIIDIYYKYRIEHNLIPGEIILIDNNRAVHGRSSFIPNYDGYDRFLIRSFITFDYEKSKYARKDRTIKAIYS